MKKKKAKIAKEIIILMLLTILIMLILAVALYDFIPSNIQIPEIKEYSSDSTTTAIKQEIEYTNGGDLGIDMDKDKDKDEEIQTALKSYSIDSSDLTVYGQKNLYNSGNSNPFDYATEEQPSPSTGGNTTSPNGQNTTQTNTNSSTSTNTSSSTNTTNQSAGKPTNSTTGTFFENPASK